MTKKLIYLEDAIDALAEQLYYNEDDYRTAVKAIGGLPSAQPELDEWCPDCKEYDSKRHCCPRLNRVIRQMVKDAQSERKKGRWIDKGMEGSWNYCSVCGERAIDLYDYCPNCGADMRGESE